jgi:hypothetical protein
MLITSNLDGFLENVKKTLASKDLLKEVANAVYKESKRRIFDDGLNVNNEKIGNYRPTTAAIRRRLGLRTDYVNLTFTGVMKRGYRLRSTSIGYVIGFDDVRNQELVRYNEDHFRCRIFGLSRDDERVAQSVIEKYIKNLGHA